MSHPTTSKMFGSVLRWHVSIFVCMIFSICTFNAHILEHTTIIIMSQKAHSNKAIIMREKLRESMNVYDPTILLLHEDLPVLGGWTIFPILSPLLKRYSRSIKWFVFLDERSSVDPIILASLLETYNATDKIFMGRGINDQLSTSTYIWDKSANLTYPQFSAGFVISKNLAKTIVKELDAMDPLDNDQRFKNFARHFSIGNNSFAAQI